MGGCSGGGEGGLRGKERIRMGGGGGRALWLRRRE